MPGKLLRWVFTQQIQSLNSSRQSSGHVQFIACFKEKASTANAQIFHGLTSQTEFVEWKPYRRNNLELIPYVKNEETLRGKSIQFHTRKINGYSRSIVLKHCGTQRRSKNDTWTENELLKAIQGDSKDKRQRSSRDRSSTRERDQSRRSSEKEQVDKTKPKEGETSGEKERKQKSRSSRSKEEVKKRESSRGARHEEDVVRDKKKHRDDKDNRHTDGKHKSESREGSGTITGRSTRKYDVEGNSKVHEKIRDKDGKKGSSSKDRGKSSMDNDKKRDEKYSEKKHNGKREKDTRERRKETKDPDERKHRKKERDESSKKEKETKAKEKPKERPKKVEQEKPVPEIQSNKFEENGTVDEDEYNYDEDEFDDYDDDFEDEDENVDSTNDDEIDKTDDETFEKEAEDHVGTGESNSSSPDEKMMPQQSMLNMTLSEKRDMNEVLQAISAENEKLSSQASSRGSSGRSTGSRKQVSEKQEDLNLEKKTFGKINFMAASKKQINQRAAMRNKQRGEKLMELIQLDVRSIDLFELPPMTEYELYMKRFGQSDCKQMFTQTKDDNITQEIQTDDLKTETRWCQHTHDVKTCGVVHSDGTMGNTSKDTYNPILSVDSARLNKFLMKASRVCVSLLEEIEAGIEQPQRQYTDSKTEFSDGFVTLSSSDFLIIGRNFSDIAYSPQETNMLLTAYGESNVVEGNRKSSKGLICVWNTNEPTKPYKLLACESTPTSCCFSTGTASLVFAGMDDGVIALWDLREPSSFHDLLTVGRSKQVFRSATFTTAGLAEHHSFPVLSVTPVSAAKTGSSSQRKDGIDMSFQLISMDESGLVNIWVVVEVHQESSDMTNLKDDMGLSPKGTVKLVKSSTVLPPSSSLSPMETLFSVTCFGIDPVKSSHMYLGTDQGIIHHQMRFSNRPSPKKFTLSEDSSSTVTAIDVSSFEFPFLLASYSNGIVSLFNLKRESPVITWSEFSKGNAVVDVKWSRSKPSIFFAIDDQSFLYSWDLLESDTGPRMQQKISRKDKRAIGFTFSNDYSALGIGTPRRCPEMALIYGDGSVEIHRMSKDLTKMEGSELDQMHEFFEDIT